ncbi:MAG: radical SAM protein [Chloroflexota bacterium]
MPSGITFEEIECKTIINRVQAPGMGFSYTINPYRGCQHACIYCFARGTHEYLGYDSGRDFESRIVVKMNAATVLRQQLRRPSWKRELIVLGTACDPYQQAEIKYGITHRILEVMLDFAQPVHMLTKSTAVVRDLELWASLAKVADAQVAFSIPTLDEEIWKKMEPGTARPHKRFEAMRELTSAGVRCGVMIAPVIPGLTDDDAHIEPVVAAAREAGASFVAPNVLFLKPGTKEWFMPALRSAYPHLAGKYERYYRGAYAPKDYTREVIAGINRLREKYGFTRERDHHAVMTRERPPARNSQIALGI